MEVFKHKHLALDFDNTIAYFEGGREGIFDLFNKFGISPSLVEGAYEQSKKNNGFSIDKLIDEVAAKTGKSFDRNAIKEDFSKWLKRSLKLYPDTRELIERLKKNKIIYSIVTVGDKEYQQQKIDALGLKPHSLTVVSKVGQKPAVLQRLVLENGPVTYVDDKASELDSIRSELAASQVQTVRIIRQDSPYKDERGKYKHITVSNLNDLGL